MKKKVKEIYFDFSTNQPTLLKVLTLAHTWQGFQFQKNFSMGVVVVLQYFWISNEAADPKGVTPAEPECDCLLTIDVHLQPTLK